MSVNGLGLESALREWDEKMGEARKPRISKGGGGGGLKPRETLKAIAQRTPQAILKITGGGKGGKGVSAHLTYISRHGELKLEDQDGQVVEGRGAHRQVLERWELTGSPMPREGTSREAFNFVLSSPAGSSPQAVLAAARAWAKEQFGSRHDYVMALHEPGTDPSPKRTENPHVHIAVKARDTTGKKLNPRKADLQAYRLAYARHLRSNGINVVAISRQARFKTDKGVPLPVHHMKKRGATLDPASPTQLAEAKRLQALRNEAQARETYIDLVAGLAKSDLPGDAELAKALREVLPIQAPTLPAQQQRKGPQKGPRR